MRFVFALAVVSATSSVMAPVAGWAEEDRQAKPSGVLQQAEDLAKAASEEFSDLLAPDKKKTDAAPGAAETVAADGEPKPDGDTTIDTALAPVWDWLARSAKTYDGVVVAQLRSGENWNATFERNGISTGTVIAAATTGAAVANADASAHGQESAEPHGWGGLVETVRDWLARANRSYRNEIVKPLRDLLPGTPTEFAQPEKEQPPVKVSHADASGVKPVVTIPKPLVADAASRRRAEKERKAQREAATVQLAEQTARVKESEARRLADVEAKNKIAREAQAQRLAAEAAAQTQRDAAKKARQAAEKAQQRLAAEAEATAKRQQEAQRIARATNLAKASEARRLAELETKAQTVRAAEEQRKAELAEAERAAEVARTQAEARRLLTAAAEEKARTKREAEAQRIAKASAQARESETRRLADVAAKAKADAKRQAEIEAEQQQRTAEEAAERARKEAEAKSRRAAEEAAERAAVAEAKRQAEIEAEAERRIAAARAKAERERQVALADATPETPLATPPATPLAGPTAERQNSNGDLPQVSPPAASNAAPTAETIKSYTAPVPPLPTTSKGGVDLSPVPPASELARSGVPVGEAVVMEHSSIATEPKVAVNSQGGNVASRASNGESRASNGASRASNGASRAVKGADVAVPEKKSPVSPEKKSAARRATSKIEKPEQKPLRTTAETPTPKHERKAEAPQRKPTAQDAPVRKPAAPPSAASSVPKARKEVLTAEVAPPVAKKKLRKRVTASAAGSGKTKAYAVRKSGRKIARVHHGRSVKHAYRQHRAMQTQNAVGAVRGVAPLKRGYRVRRCACPCVQVAPRKLRRSVRVHHAGPRVVKLERRQYRKVSAKHKPARAHHRRG